MDAEGCESTFPAPEDPGASNRKASAFCLIVRDNPIPGTNERRVTQRLLKPIPARDPDVQKPLFLHGKLAFFLCKNL